MTHPILLTGEEKRKFSIFSVIFSVLVILIIALFLFELWFLRRFTPVNVDGPSMNMTLSDGDWLYADSKATAKREDIVIIDVHDYKNEYGHALFQDGGIPITYIIKRVIALEGDEIYARDNQVFLKKQGETDFELLKESYAYYEPSGSPLMFGSERDPVKVGKGEMFVLGDNRLNSHDSSEIGTLFVEDITGVVPDWAVKNKELIGKWENFRDIFRN